MLKYFLLTSFHSLQNVPGNTVTSTIVKELWKDIFNNSYNWNTLNLNIAQISDAMLIICMQ